MVTSRRRADRQTRNSDDGLVGIRGLAINRMNGRTPINNPGIYSSLYAKPLDSSSRNGVFHSELKLYQRRRQTSYILHIFTLTLMAVVTGADALHRAAFVGRIGRSSLLKSPSANQDYAWLTSHSASSIWYFSVDKTSIQVKSIRNFPSLWLAQSPETEMQTENAQSKVDDEEEWRTVLAAFKMYKAAYGDLKVPSRFVVPGMAPWPGENFYSS